MQMMQLIWKWRDFKVISSWNETYILLSLIFISLNEH